MATPSPPFKFGDFGFICNRIALPICPALGLGEPQCYSRNIGFGNFLMFQASTLVLDLTALLMTIIMIYHIKTKYTAVGRKEMVLFFYLYMINIILEFFLVSNILPFSTKFYSYTAAAQIASMSATFFVLFLNGFLGLQWFEDGTRWSLWTFRGSAALVFTVVYIITFCTMKGLAGLSPRSPMLLYIIYFIFNAALLAISLIMQMFVVKDLEAKWALGDIFFGVVFLLGAMVAYFGVSNETCRITGHYMDGMFLGGILMLLAVMMVYKYWDSITMDDLEYETDTGAGPKSWELDFDQLKATERHGLPQLLALEPTVSYGFPDSAFA